MCSGRRQVEITHEESYISQQAEDLRLHTVTCEELLQSFRADVDITHIPKTDFIIVLQNLGLLCAGLKEAESSPAW